MSTESHIAEFREAFHAVRDEVGKVIVGHLEIVDGTLIALFGGGHVLLEGVPGLGKTLLVRTLGEVLDLSFSRIQFTPDLMPADILGTNLVMDGPDGRRGFQFQHGPIFAHLVLADEINRATPKTQSALLEAMQEKQVTAGGSVRKLEEPFFVLATQNPIDQEGTYPLPEAQLDRFFFKLLVGYPSAADLAEVIERTTGGTTAQVGKVIDGQKLHRMQRLVREVPVASHVKDYAVRIVLATHPKTGTAAPISNQFLRFGSSPRGAQTLILAGKVRALAQGRFNVSFEDIQWAARPALRHRLIPNFEAEAEGVTTDAVIDRILADVPTDPVAAAA
ncbi:MAG: MoxR family ATPase [Verrucomicrobiales bacterium]|nr:MoxR family ATPase [Verrucomicrobiales bacterium]